MFTEMKRRLSAAEEKSSRAMTDRSEPRPRSVLRAVERWRRFISEDDSVTDSGRENSPSTLEPLLPSCNDETCRHEFAEMCSPNPCDLCSNSCVVCEKFIWNFWHVQTCVECGVKKHHDCVAVVGVSGGATTAASTIGSTGWERSKWLASDVDEVVTRECTSTETFLVRARDAVDETECESSGDFAGTSSERCSGTSTPAPLEVETFENARVLEVSSDETRAVEATSGLKSVKIECPVSDVSTTCLEQSVRATTPILLEAEAFENAEVVGEFFSEVLAVEVTSGLASDKIECPGRDVSTTCLERSVRAMTPIPFEAGHGLTSEPKKESKSLEIIRLKSTVVITGVDRTANDVSSAGVSERTVGAESLVGNNNDDKSLVAIDPTVRRPPTVRREDVRLFTKCKILPRNNAHSQMKNYVKKVNGFLNKPQGQPSVDHLIKYWIMQNRLFSRFSMGILLDEESFYSVCPEVLCDHIANKCKCETIVDPFCGAGGNIIQFTKTCSRVIGVDVDSKKIKLAINNAEVYGVRNRIELKTGDYFQRDSGLKADVVFMSPPWGGPEYVDKPVYSFAGMCSKNGGGRRVLEIAREIAPKIAIHLPRNLDKDECVMLARELNFKYVLFENNYIGNKMNSTTMYLK